MTSLITLYEVYVSFIAVKNVFNKVENNIWKRWCLGLSGIVQKSSQIVWNDANDVIM